MKRSFWIPTILSLLICSTSAYSVCSQHLSVIAHRGNSSEAPENTIAAFQSAVNMGVDFVELDVHLCKEGIPCVIHDQSLTRTTDSEGIFFIESTSLDQLKTLDAGEWFSETFTGEKIPTLEEILQMPLGNTGVMIEIKEGSAASEVLAANVAAVVRKFSRVKSGNPLIVGSLSPEIAVQLRTYLPELPLIAIVEDLNDLAKFKPAEAKIYAVRYDLLNQEIYNRLSSEGKVIWTFTVDDKNTMHKMVDLGVSGIITNRPKELIEVRKKLAEKCLDVINVSRAY